MSVEYNRISDFKKENSGDLYDITITDISHSEESIKGSLMVKSVIGLIDELKESIQLDIWDKREIIDKNFHIGEKINLLSISSFFDVSDKTWRLKANVRSRMVKDLNELRPDPLLEGILKLVEIDAELNKITLNLLQDTKILSDGINKVKRLL